MENKGKMIISRKCPYVNEDTSSPTGVPVEEPISTHSDKQTVEGYKDTEKGENGAERAWVQAMENKGHELDTDFVISAPLRRELKQWKTRDMN
jgi:hypothetical protein